MPTSNELSVKTLQEAILKFSDEQTCIDALAAMRWPDGVTCPACGHKEHLVSESAEALEMQRLPSPVFRETRDDL